MLLPMWKELIFFSKPLYRILRCAIKNRKSSLQKKMPIIAWTASTVPPLGISQKNVGREGATARDEDNTYLGIDNKHGKILILVVWYFQWLIV